jgi:hypothetical protein
MIGSDLVVQVRWDAEQVGAADELGTGQGRCGVIRTSAGRLKWESVITAGQVELEVACKDLIWQVLAVGARKVITW